MHTEASRSPFDLAALRAGLASADVEVPRIEWSAACPSTNDALAEAVAAAADEWPDFSVCGTDHQTAGHGRLGRTWTVPAAASLTFSTVMRVPVGFDLAGLGWLPLIAGWAVAEAVDTAGVSAQVKWPNDVLVDGKKLCGILSRACQLPAGSEAAMAIVLGIGINVDITEDELPVETATSIALSGGTITREQLLAEVLRGLHQAIPALFSSTTAEAFAQSAAADAIRNRMVTLGMDVRAELPGDVQLRGKAVDVDAGGNLIIDTGAGREVVSAGEVTHLRPAR